MKKLLTLLVAAAFVFGGFGGSVIAQAADAPKASVVKSDKAKAKDKSSAKKKAEKKKTK